MTFNEILNNYEVSLSEDYENDIQLKKVILDILKVLAYNESAGFNKNIRKS